MKQRFLEDVIRGLGKPRKELPCKWFYDERGSELFEAISKLDEYYLTRTELAIMSAHAHEMAALIGERALLIEYGSGSGEKTRLLLDRLEGPAAYVPVDISKKRLERTAHELAAAYPRLEVLPVCADFTGGFDLPSSTQAALRKVVYFPGSTIGNFTPSQTVAFLRGIASVCGPGGGLLIGADLKKDARVIEAAYNDRKGTTRDFNLNILVRINRELGANFQVQQFRHHAFYNEVEGRVEINLVCLEDQRVSLDGEAFDIRKGESIRTECSYKYSLEGFRRLVRGAGLDVEKQWVDADSMFSVFYLNNT